MGQHYFQQGEDCAAQKEYVKALECYEKAKELGHPKADDALSAMTVQSMLEQIQKAQGIPMEKLQGLRGILMNKFGLK